MNEFKPILRLVIAVQIFLLFVMIIFPAVIRNLSQPEGKFVYGVLTVISILQALLLRRALSKLE